MTRLFITGTDTGVGKTFVTCGLARQLSANGQRVFAFKPVETGCTLVNASLIGDDQEQLCAAAGGWQQGELRGVYRFAMPAAPRVAATEPIELARILEVFERGCAQSNHALVEGAGGWRVPITDSEDMGSIAKALSLPVLIVARAGLGTINHTVLTAEAVTRDGLLVSAIVLSALPTDDLAFAKSNADEIRHMTGHRVELVHAGSFPRFT